ncbi:hypothetical protein ElyMa_000360100 [Elysia marginata]|uniref:ABC transmembrane type-1 domain-containing protein n=1 Tax=Elysia marginata TaxID=1093978 RepID=A0AAV4FFK7_9GAST|nr:hypothetical protein ElyMa_000360100 [Elysia marginata]
MLYNTFALEQNKSTISVVVLVVVVVVVVVVVAAAAAVVVVVVAVVLVVVVVILRTVGYTIISLVPIKLRGQSTRKSTS